MATGEKRGKKRNFSDTEIETLVGEVEARKTVLFGGHSSGVTNKKKQCEWQSIASAVNCVSGTERTVAELKKKWSDLKVYKFFTNILHLCFIRLYTYINSNIDFQKVLFTCAYSMQNM